MREFIRLQFKLKWGFNRNNSKTSAAMTAAAALFAVVLVLALVLALSFVLDSAFRREGILISAKRLSVLYLTLILSGLTVAAIGMQAKRLYRPGDLSIAARFPLSPFKMFLSYLVLNYIDLCIYSAILLLPVMTVFGVAMKCITLSYAAGVLLGTVLFPLVPFGVSIFLAIPAVYLTSLLERHGIVRLVLFVCFLAGAFALYYYLLTVLAQFFIHGNWEEGTLKIWEKLLVGLDSYYNPAYYLGNVVFFENFWLGLGAIAGTGVLLAAGGTALARLVCAKFRADALDTGGSFPSRRTKVDGMSGTRAIFRYQFREILRTKTYSYFYLGVAISAPVMVFFCDRLATMVGTAQVGTGINFGVSMLVVSVFMAMICSFTGTVLSVEGKNFYLTKLVPVPYRRQLLVKAALHIAVSAVALLISAVVIGCLQFLNAAEMAVLAVSELFLTVGLVFNGINLNLANPNLKPKANGEPEEINITYMFIIGLVIAALLGAGCILFPRTVVDGTAIAYLVAGFAAFFYAAINLIVFWYTANKKYAKIEA